MEQVMVTPIDHCDADLRARKIARDFKTAETDPDDDYTMSGVNCHS